MSTPKWAVGMERIGPGIYVNKEGEAHVSLLEICEEMNVPPTPENQAIAEAAGRDAFERNFGKLPVTNVDDSKEQE